MICLLLKDKISQSSNNTGYFIKDSFICLLSVLLWWSGPGAHTNPYPPAYLWFLTWFCSRFSKPWNQYHQRRVEQTHNDLKRCKKKLFLQVLNFWASKPNEFLALLLVEKPSQRFEVRWLCWTKFTSHVTFRIQLVSAVSLVLPTFTFLKRKPAFCKLKSDSWVLKDVKKIQRPQQLDAEVVRDDS